MWQHWSCRQADAVALRGAEPPGAALGAGLLGFLTDWDEGRFQLTLLHHLACMNQIPPSFNIINSRGILFTLACGWHTLELGQVQ